jgi:hypothetical protein
MSRHFQVTQDGLIATPYCEEQFAWHEAKAECHRRSSSNDPLTKVYLCQTIGHGSRLNGSCAGYGPDSYALHAKRWIDRARVPEVYTTMSRRELKGARAFFAACAAGTDCRGLLVRLISPPPNGPSITLSKSIFCHVSQ